MSDPGLFFTPGSCDAASLATILVVAAVTALVPVRLPGDVLITFLPAMLLPSWLVCGGLPTSDVAVVASIIAGLRASVQGVPFMPFAGLGGSDLPKASGFATSACWCAIWTHITS